MTLSPQLPTKRGQTNKATAPRTVRFRIECSPLHKCPVIGPIDGYQRQGGKKRTRCHLPGRIAALSLRPHACQTPNPRSSCWPGPEQAIRVPSNHFSPRNAGPLRRWTHGRLPRWARDVSDTPDLVQDVLLQTFKRLEHFQPQSEVALQAYLRQAVMNRVRDELRRHRRRPGTVELDSRDTSTKRRRRSKQPSDKRRWSDMTKRCCACRNRSGRDRGADRAGNTLYEESAELLGKPTPNRPQSRAAGPVRLAEEMKHGR